MNLHLGSALGKPQYLGQVGLGVTGLNPAGYAAGLYYANDHVHLPGDSRINSFTKNIAGVEKHLGKQG